MKNNSKYMEKLMCTDVDFHESHNKSKADLLAAEIQDCRNLLPAKINLSSLDSVPLAQRDELPNVPGIYFVLEDANVIYIGLSKRSLLKRWWTHEKLKTFKERSEEIKIAWFICCAVDLLPLIESTLIGYFDPELNHTVGEGIPRYFRQKRQQLEEADTFLGRRVELRKTDWLAVEEVAAKLKLNVDEALMWVIRLGAPDTVTRYQRLLKRFENKVKS